MRATLVLDDELVARAQALTGVKEKTLLVQEALRHRLRARARGSLLV